jgi:dipeptidyl aminopeptidase/acylaminoacyl peptidase
LFKNLARPFNASVLVMVSFLSFAVPICGAQQPKKPFTVPDEIALTLFGTPSGAPPKVRFSPDNKYFAVWSERGRVDLNVVEDSLRFYRSQDAQNFLSHSRQSGQLSPLWIATRSAKEGPIIDDWRWLPNSQGVAFLQRTPSGHQRLVLADLASKTIEPLTTAAEQVKSFDIRDRQHYVYTVTDPVPLQEIHDERRKTEVVGTGRLIWQLVLPDNARSIAMSSHRNYLCAVLGGKRFAIKRDGASIQVSDNLVLSPDGKSLVATLPVPEVPVSWETLYPPPYASFPYRIHAGRVPSTAAPVNQYVRIDLRTGSVLSLTDAPTSNDAGWFASGSPSWSSDGEQIVLPGTFIESKDRTPSRPCVAVVDLLSRNRTCVEVLKAETETGVEEGYHMIRDAQFVDGDERRVMVSFYNHLDHSPRTTEYRLTADGRWQAAGQSKGEANVEHNGLEISVKQSFKEAPLLVALDKLTSQVIWDPNPRLKEIELGQASIYTWKDKDGRERRAGLFKPSDYKPGQRYPLVIQTHGFAESEFRPSGVFPTGMAARALAEAGIMVLQTEKVGECTDSDTPDEGPCKVSAIETVARRLVSEGLVDPEQIGIIGFSATCHTVMEVLTTGSFHIKAALITDGVLVDYLQYLLQIQSGNELDEENSTIGAPPFGQGLKLWLERSPGFNLDKVNAPLLVVGEGPASLLAMWQPYAGLRYLHKPVDLIMLNTDEHILTNPAVRMASQGGSVDWFRFWLQDYEDPDPAKAEQYVRWRELRKLQEQNQSTARTN